MPWRKDFFFFFFLLRTSLRASMSVQKAFCLQSIFMVINNLFFVFTWWVFFEQFENIAGWEMKEMTALLTMGLGACGLMQIAGGGTRSLSAMIVSGDLDPLMTQPKSLLLHLVGSRSLSRGWGHLMTALILIIFGGVAHGSNIVLILLGIVCGAIVFTAMGIMAHSLAFWLGSIESVPRKYQDSLFLFALYPTNIYSGVMQVLMFSVIPAGIIGYLPVELLRCFSWMDLGLLLLSAGVFLTVAVLIFYGGLKRYESGNRFGIRV